MAFINTLYNLWPNGDQKVPGLRDGIAISAQTVFPLYGITTPLIIAHVMAQISHECGAGHDVVESLNYSAQRMTEVWPRRFPTIASAEPYAHNEVALGVKTYGGRMGNRPGTNDGYTYRGRGGSQTTGREGYERLQKITGLPLLEHPELVNDPDKFLLCAVADFVACGCLPYAKKDDVAAVSAALNVGDPTRVDAVVGMADRRLWLARWKAALGDGPVDFTVPGSPATKPIQPSPSPPAPAPAPKKTTLWDVIGSFFSIFFKRKS